MKTVEKLVQDMIKAIETIESFTINSYDLFLQDEMTQDAIMYNLIILGEAANGISEEYQESHPSIPWSSIIGTRNVIVHGYDQVKLQIVWDIINHNLPSLKESLLQLSQSN